MKKKLISSTLVGVTLISALSACGNKEAENVAMDNEVKEETTVEQNSDEPIDVLNQEETLKLSIVTMQGYTAPDSFWPWIQGSGDGLGRMELLCKDDGTYVHGAATEDCKKWLGRVAKLYADGVITPNIVTDTDRGEQMANGGYGG